MNNGCDLVIQTIGLGKSYCSGIGSKTVMVLDSVDLVVYRGEIFGILGANGAGKSTTLKILAGLVRPTHGEAWLFDHSSDDPEVRRRTGFLPDMPAFQEYLTAEESLVFSGRLAGLPYSTVCHRVDQVFSTVGLDAVRHRRLGTYSKGMLQRMGLAQTLIHDPDLIILDEPMSGLDPMGRADVRDLLLQLKQAGKTILLSSHLLHDVELLCDRIGVLDKGRLVVKNSRQELTKTSRSRPVDLVLEGLGDKSIAEVRFMSTAFFLETDRVVATLAHASSVEAVLELVRRDKARIVSLQPRASLETLLTEAPYLT